MNIIDGCRFTWQDERQLQDGLEDALTQAGLTVHREVVLAPHERIDFLVDRVGVEVKVKGAPHTVARQLQRYAHSDRIDALVLVTSRAQHLTLPDQVAGTPVRVVFLGAAL